MVLIFVICISTVSFFSFIEIRDRLTIEWNNASQATENHITTSIIQSNKDIRLLDSINDDDLKLVFIPFLESYNHSNGEIRTIDLNAMKERFPSHIRDRINLSIIDANGIVIQSTYQKDLNLDYKQWPDIFSYITGIRRNDSFSSDRVFFGFRPGDTGKKYAYLPTPDHTHVLEESFITDQYPDERILLSYSSIIRETLHNDENIRRITLFNNLHAPVEESSEIIDTGTDTILNQVFSNKKPVVIQDRENQTIQRFFFISAQEEGNISGNIQDIVARIDYNTGILDRNIQSQFYYHLFITIIVILMGLIIAYVLSFHLTRPINRIIDDIDIIAHGNLDHEIHLTGDKEFIRLEQSIDLMIHALKKSITTLLLKEKVLHESEKRYKNVVESQHELICRYRVDGTILFVNEAFCRLFGVNNRDITGKKYRWNVPEEDEDDIRNYYRSLSPENPCLTMEYRVIIPDGTIRWLQWSDTAFFSDEGTITEIQSVGRDISDRKQIEISLTESEEKYRTLVDNLPDYVIVYRGGKILLANDACARIAGLPREEIIGHPVLEYIHEEDRKYVTKKIQKRAKGETIGDYELRLLGKEGIRNVIIHVTTISFGGSSAFLAVLTDITERKQVEEALIAGERRYRHLIEQLNEGIWVINQDAITTFTNSKMEEILGYGTGEMIGSRFFSFIDPDMKEFAETLILNRINRNSDQYEITLLKKNGDRVYAIISATPDYDNSGEFIGSFGVITNITERKLNEQKIKDYAADLERKNLELATLQDLLSQINEDLDKIVKERTTQVNKLLKQKDDFITQLGHDLKTPLTPILGLIPILRDSENHDEIQEILEIIEHNALHIRDITDKSLKLARLNSLEFEPELERVTISEIIDQIITSHRREISQRKIKIISTIDTEFSIPADKILFRELIDNLVTNAIKYNITEGGDITITAHTDQEMMNISISDSGTGILPEEQEKIFEEFYKSDHSRHDKSSTGLGLSICRRIVENHGGTIHAESAGIGEGTSFIIRLPLHKK